MSGQVADSRIYRVLKVCVGLGLWIGILVAVLLVVLPILFPSLGGHLGFTAEGFAFSGVDFTGTPQLGVLFYASTVVMLGSTLVCLWMLRDLVYSLGKGTPFFLGNVKRLRIMGWAVCVLGYARQNIGYACALNLLERYPVDAGRPWVEARLTLFPDQVLLALCILVLAEVFRLGCQLQSEHDQTV